MRSGGLRTGSPFGERVKKSRRPVHRLYYHALVMIIKMKFLKSWDLSGYSERRMSKRPTCQNEHFRANCLRDRTLVMLRKLHTNPSNFFGVDPPKN